MSSVPPIYVWWRVAVGRRPGDIVIYAITQEGTLLMRHTSSNVRYFEEDAGLTSEHGHLRYRREYPSGQYEVVKVDPDTSRDPKFKAAYEKFLQVEEQEKAKRSTPLEKQL